MKKLKQFKNWLSSKIDIPADDKIRHAIVSKWIVRPILFLGLAFPFFGIAALVLFLLIVAGLEYPQLKESNFSREAKVEALRDWLVSVDEAFNVLVALIFISTAF